MYINNWIWYHTASYTVIYVNLSEKKIPISKHNEMWNIKGYSGFKIVLLDVLDPIIFNCTFKFG